MNTKGYYKVILATSLVVLCAGICKVAIAEELSGILTGVVVILLGILSMCFSNYRIWVINHSGHKK